MSTMLRSIQGFCLLAWLHLAPVILVGLLVRSTDAMLGALLAIFCTTAIWETRFELKTWKLWKNQTTIGLGNGPEKAPAAPRAFTAKDPWGEGKP